MPVAGTAGAGAGVASGAAAGGVCGGVLVSVALGAGDAGGGAVCGAVSVDDGVLSGDDGAAVASGAGVAGALCGAGESAGGETTEGAVCCGVLVSTGIVAGGVEGWFAASGDAGALGEGVFADGACGLSEGVDACGACDAAGVAGVAVPDGGGVLCCSAVAEVGAATAVGCDAGAPTTAVGAKVVCEASPVFVAGVVEEGATASIVDGMPIVFTSGDAGGSGDDPADAGPFSVSPAAGG